MVIYGGYLRLLWLLMVIYGGYLLGLLGEWTGDLNDLYWKIRSKWSKNLN